MPAACCFSVTHLHYLTSIGGAEGDDVQVFAHDALDIMGITSSEWRTDFLRAEASTAHASELQTQIAALKEKLSKPTK